MLTVVATLAGLDGDDFSAGTRVSKSEKVALHINIPRHSFLGNVGWRKKMVERREEGEKWDDARSFFFFFFEICCC